ncbi:hypothetical protein [Chromobacterium sp.]|uniref:hypothetical protein n=1 Tax=Chromobacterium sp. TaxID=306190 RepID=UPI0035B008BD
MNLIYTSRTEGFDADGVYRHPRYFQGPEKGVASVLVEGDWPEIVAAYQALEVPVEVLEATPAAKAQRGRRLAAAGAGRPEA